MAAAVILSSFFDSPGAAVLVKPWRPQAAAAGGTRQPKQQPGRQQEAEAQEQEPGQKGQQQHDQEQEAEEGQGHPGGAEQLPP